MQLSSGMAVTGLLCFDCTLMEANGETTESPDMPPLALLSGSDYALGLLPDGHEPTCEVAGGDIDCGYLECERMDFSTSDCDGCGTTLAGYRHYITFF